jgi:hypothetical protein
MMETIEILKWFGGVICLIAIIAMMIFDSHQEDHYDHHD